MSQTNSKESTEDLKETLEILLEDALMEKKSTLSKEEREALVEQAVRLKARGYVRIRSARKLRAAKKLQQERAAKVASSLAMAVGGTAAGGMLAAFAVPSAPALAAVGAVAGLIGGAWSAWKSTHSADGRKKQKKKRQ
ncbi:hypothetical protein ACI2OW_00865 [Pseudomonas shirazica]|jgi:hypothetical protein|uniref:Uncharacterized protein n=1 Tax=Pseudomonas plecoglossicida TaxID=70775 RepID=A0A2A3M3B6_PSEDL|nr:MULTISPECIES: hypothetical protein [Pseudomonas]MDY4311397.1 hypothetical protein [Pseudomonas putida]MBF8791109.1 hypothetical protein [Pseudomonas asiatica]MDY4320983.1 hypothetical protein [Pseudomonas putida]MDY4354276.1 hypothetical protein [Pseudomonas putida]PBJ94529.1 hypothetical protein CMV24_16545 [Pseudomonas plecoglossicida]